MGLAVMIYLLLLSRACSTVSYRRIWKNVAH